MASQRVTVAKIGGVAADLALCRLQVFHSAREPTEPGLWSPEQWPKTMRAEADRFADRIRAQAFTPPVVYFAEWADPWSMGDTFPRWLTPPDGPAPLTVFADRHEIHAYPLPDGRRLAAYLAGAGPQQWPEEDWLIARLREAAAAWDSLVVRAVLVVLRHVVGPSSEDEEVSASLQRSPDWLS